MNRNFEDSLYYLKRAGETAKRGVAEEVEPIRERVESIVGEDEEPEPSRLESIRADLRDVQERAEGEAREAIADAREKLPSLGQMRSS